MTTLSARKADHLLELLADAAVQPLSRIEQAELDALLRNQTDVNEDELDLTAAALDLAFSEGEFEAMPESLRAQLGAMGQSWVASPPPLRIQTESNPRSRPATFAAWTGWFAAAAAILLAVAGWWSRGPAALPPRDALVNLQATAKDLQTLEWTSGPSASEPGATGQVVWSPSRQQGYMVFRNMRRNDPTTEQYQLWIFDKDRDERYPVDGGVFDITESGECIVPIHAAVQVNEAALFAVTIERPGGVVVSDRSRLPLLAQPKPAG